jgi:hypothetical protein
MLVSAKQFSKSRAATKEINKLFAIDPSKPKHRDSLRMRWAAIYLIGEKLKRFVSSVVVHLFFILYLSSIENHKIWHPKK